MDMTGYELLWLFFTYRFAGWVIGTAGAAVRQTGEGIETFADG